LLAWMLFQALSFVSDIIFRALPAVVVFFAGAALFTWPVKTIPPERTILLALGIGRKSPRRKTEKVKKKAPTKAPAPTVKVSKAQAVVGEPLKIVGTLRDPSLGTPLANKSFEVYADGTLFYRGVTDEQGGFAVVFIPQDVGIVKITVKPEGVVGAEQSIEVAVSGAPAEVR